MQALLKTIIDEIRENLGHPVKLARLLGEHPDIRVSLDAPAPCISSNSVVQWDALGCSSYPQWPRRKQGSLMGWKMLGNDYGSFILHRPEYSKIVQCEITENWVCDITDVHGFAASKSNLHDFVSTDQMVEANSRDMIDTITHQKLAENLEHNGIHIIHSLGLDYFLRYSWDGRIFLMNSDGSHHFAAAKYIATRLSEAIALRGKLYSYSLNTLAIASLRRDFEIFVISDDTPISLGFHNAMRAFRAAWLWHSMPRPFENTKAILLPKVERRSMQVAALLRNAGVADLGVHLTDLAETRFV